MYLLGIHPDGDYFKVALISSKGRKNRILFLQEFKKDILDLNQLKKRILKETRYKEDKIEVISALPPDEVFVRTISFPFRGKQAIAKALPFQLEKVLPFAEEYATSVPLIKIGKKGSLVTLHTYLNESLEQHIQDIKTLGFDPDSVSPLAKALHRFAKVFTGDLKTHLTLHFGWEKSYLICVKEEQIKHSLTLEFGFKGFIDAVKIDYPHLENIDYALIQAKIKEQKSAKGKEKGALLEEISHAKKTLFRSLEFLRRKEEFEEFPMIYTGYGEIGEEIANSLEDFSLHRIEILPHLEFDRNKLAAYAIEIGLALEGAEKDKEFVELRQGIFTSGRQIKKVKKKTALFLSSALLCSLVVSATLFSTYVKRLNHSRERFQRVIALGGAGIKEYPKMQKRLFSVIDCQEAISKFLKKHQNEQTEERFFQIPPLVATFLEGISYSATKGIVIQSFHYSLDSYPHLEQVKNPFLVKVEVSFSAPSKEAATEFWQKVVENQKEKVQERSITGEGNVFQATITLKR